MEIEFSLNAAELCQVECELQMLLELSGTTPCRRGLNTFAVAEDTTEWMIKWVKFENSSWTSV